MTDEQIAINQLNVENGNQIRVLNPSSNLSEETLLLGADAIYVGQSNPDVPEIAVDDLGFKYARDKVEGVEVYNMTKKKRKAWFVLDLETGGRGWYPGSKEVVDISTAKLYAEPNDNSMVLSELAECTLDKLDMVYGTSKETSGKIIYCYVQKEDDSSIVGYIKANSILRTYFKDRKE